MSRSGYTEDCDDQWGLIRWRGAVSSAIKGERGQRLLTELVQGLDAMPVKRLIADELVVDGEFCALGVVGCARGIEMVGIDPEDSDAVAKAFNIAPALAREIVFINDDYYNQTPEARFTRVRQWAEKQLSTTKDLK